MEASSSAPAVGLHQKSSTFSQYHLRRLELETIVVISGRTLYLAILSKANLSNHSPNNMANARICSRSPGEGERLMTFVAKAATKPSFTRSLGVETNPPPDHL
ncbi:MAG: hypothetical protein ACI96M_001172 [Candidatus Azotimanducaceae bacterium]|jgi:hypothetical protein